MVYASQSNEILCVTSYWQKYEFLLVVESSFPQIVGLPPTYMIKLCDWSIMRIEDNKLQIEIIFQSHEL